MVLFRGDEGSRRPHRAAARAGLIALSIGCGALSAPAGNPPHHGTETEEAAPKKAANEKHSAAPASPICNSVCAQARAEAATGEPNKHQDEGAPKWTDIVVAAASIVTAGFGIALWLSTRNLWKETKRLAKGAEDQHGTLKASVEEARRAADAAGNAADAAVAAQRPWIRVELEPDGLVQNASNGVRVKLISKYRNVGNSPATNVQIWSVMRLAAKPHVWLDERGIWPADDKTGFSIFPAVEGIKDVWALIPKSELVQDGGAIGHFHFVVTVDATYRFVGGEGHTRKEYELKGPHMMEAIDIGKLPVQADQIRLESLPFNDVAS